jgi:hypothetical protein
VRTVVRTRLHTVVRTRTRTVVKTVPPKVPSTAFLPSTHPALALTRFTVPGGNLGCQIGGGGARCSVQQRLWAAGSREPRKCRTSRATSGIIWGDTISLSIHGPAKFFCGKSAFSSDAQVIPYGWDDKVGQVTCQVRAIGIDCFSKSHHGLLISRTGYAAY